jgi:hypothetical protein
VLAADNQVEESNEQTMSDEKEKKPQAWYVRHEGLPMGPFAGSKIRHLLQNGDLTMEDQISIDRKQWLRMLEVPEVVPIPLRAEAGDAEAIAFLKHRHQAEVSNIAEENRIPWTALAVVLVLVVGILVGALWVGMPDSSDTPLCDAVPAPGVNWRNCLLSGIDVGSASLEGANLNNTVLREAKLSATNLSKADIQYADLRGADLRYADLRGSRLLGANLQKADLRGANLSQSDLRFADFSDGLLDEADLSGANLGGAIWVDGSSCAEQSIGHCVPQTP